MTIPPMTKALRIRCSVPYCNHTRGFRKGDAAPPREGEEWICGKHWMAVPRMLRRVHYRLLRELRKGIARDPLFREYWKHPPRSEQRQTAWALWRRHDRIWKRCKREAIERGLEI